MFTVTTVNIITWVVLTGVLGFLGGWYGRPKGICQETGQLARYKKCPVHGDGGALCGYRPEKIIPEYHRKIAWMTAERDHFRGRVSRSLKRRRETDKEDF